MRHPRRFLAPVAIAFLAGCTDQPTDPHAPRLGPAAPPSLAISDGAHGGAAGFYFLPPLVPAPVYSGTFDGTRSPTVRVCALAGSACGATVATFSGAQVKVDLAGEAYAVTWKTKGAGLDPAQTYRIEVAVGAQVLGHADVVVVANKSQAKSVDNSQFVAVISGGTLQIRFRIESGAGSPPPPPGPWQDGDVISYTQASWGDPLAAGGAELAAHYDAVYASAFGLVEIGISGSSAYSIIFTGSGPVLNYLPSSGPATPLNADLVDPTSSASGIFGGEVLGLRFNIDFADAGFTLGSSGVRFGDLTLCGLTSTLAGLNGLSVRAFSSIVNTALGGGSTPYAIADLNQAAFDINRSFLHGAVSSFAQQHLVNGACSAAGWQDGDVISHSQTSWGEPTLPGGPLLAANFDAVYASSLVEVGISGTAGYSIIVTSATVVEDYLPATRPAAPLNADLVDPLSSASGVFGGEVLALRFNLDFSDAGLMLGTSGIRFGDLTLCGFTGTLAGLNGLSVRAFSTIVNTALGGGATPYAIADVNQTAFMVNNAFNNGAVNLFAQQHLFAGACPP